MMSFLGNLNTKSPKILVSRCFMLFARLALTVILQKSTYIISLVYVVFYIHRDIQSVSGSPIQRPRNLRAMVRFGTLLLLVDCIGGVQECVGMVWGGIVQDESSKSGRVVSMLSSEWARVVMLTLAWQMTIAGSSLSLLMFLCEIGLVSWMREIW
jgi:hypothetical protein